MHSLKQFCILIALLSLAPLSDVSAQTMKTEQATTSPELQVRIHQLIAMLGPDPTRGTCMPNPYLPTNQAKLELIAIGKPATLPLCAVLKDKDTWRRIMAVETLAELRDRHATRSLLEALRQDTSPTVRGMAAQALGNLGAKDAVEALIEALQYRSKDPKDHYPAYVTGRAAEALGKIGDRRASAPLLTLLGVREYAMGATPGFRFPLGPEVAEALGKMGPKAAEPLLQALKHPNRDVRSDAAKALGILKEHRAVPLLLKMLTPPLEELEDSDAAYEDFKLGVEAIKALGDIGDRRATQPLLKRVHVKKLQHLGIDESSVVVIEALGKIGDPQAVETLLRLLPSKDSYVRRRSLEALWRIKTPKVVEPLLNALQSDDDPILRYDVADWLGQMQELRALPLLTKALTDEDDNVRDIAAVSIGRIDSDHLLMLLQDSDTNVRRAVVHGLGIVRCPQAVPRLLSLIRDEELGYRVMDALGKLGTPEILSRLEPFIHDKNQNTRFAALHAIIAIRQRHNL